MLYLKRNFRLSPSSDWWKYRVERKMYKAYVCTGEETELLVKVLADYDVINCFLPARGNLYRNL